MTTPIIVSKLSLKVSNKLIVKNNDKNEPNKISIS